MAAQALYPLGFSLLWAIFKRHLSQHFYKLLVIHNVINRHRPHRARALGGPEGADFTNRLQSGAAHRTTLCQQQSFSLHAEVRCGINQRNKLEYLCRYFTRPTITNERLILNHACNVVLQFKGPYRDGYYLI